jgi:Aerotolerance regulator N-terminal/von Willebrand factor type A domain
MNFLSPWFLLGGLAVAGPVLFHLMRRSAREKVSFSSLLFLRPTPPRATRRRRLEHIILMLLRCLVLLLLAAGFARPFFRKSDASALPPGAGHQTVVLIDTSASMRRFGLWQKAVAVAGRYLAKAELRDRVAVVAFDQHSHTLVSFSDWASWAVEQRVALAKQRLDAITPGWGGTDLGPALTDAAELFQEDAGGTNAYASREVALVSDLQEGAKLDGLQGHDWPKGVRVILEKVDPDQRGNAGLEILEASLDSAGDAREARARVANARDSDGQTFLMGWTAPGATDFTGKPVEVYLPPGQTRTFAAPPLPAGATTGSLRLTGAQEDFDNTTWFAASEMEKVTVAYFGSESANDPQQLRYYLQRSFPETARRQVLVVSAVSNSVFSKPILDGAALAVIPASLATNELLAMRDWIAGGKTALLVMTNAQAGATLTALLGGTNAQVSEATGDYALLGDINFAHPIFAPFADPQYSDFSHIHFWQHRRWTIQTNLTAHVLAKFDDGSPALTQMPMGKGNLLVLAAGWQPSDSQLALSTKFLPMMQTILDWSGGAAGSRTQFEIGQVIPSPVASGDPLHWLKPDGKSVEIAAGTPFTETDAPGIYSVTIGSKLHQFAVNLPLDESRTAPLTPDQLASLGVPIGTAPQVADTQAPVRQRLLLATELENRQKIWRWLIAGLLGVAFVEIVLGGWLARRVKALEVTP